MVRSRKVKSLGEPIMKMSRIPLVILALVFFMSGCVPSVAPLPTPTSVPSPNIPIPTVVPTVAAATLPETSAATEIPVDLHAPYDENAIPADDIVHAMAQSASDGKLVLLDFGANWCPDCLVLTTLFEDPAVKPFLEENYHVVRIDVGMWDKNLDISQAYGNPIDNGIPAVVVLSPTGEIIATTKDGSLANARTATAEEILALITEWYAQKP